MTTYTLKLGNFVEFPVAFTVNDGEDTRSFKFRLVGKRISRPDMLAALGIDTFAQLEDNPEAIAPMLVDHITGWKEQTLVLEEHTGQPAAYTTEGLQLILSLWGAEAAIFGGYLKALGIKEGSTAKDARAKN